PPLGSSANPSGVGQPVTFTATVIPGGSGTPSGVVSFVDGSTTLGQGTLTTSGSTTTASFTTSSLAAGSHIITANYSGDSNFLSSSGSVTQTVNNTTSSTTTVSGASANPPAFRPARTFTATATTTR